MSEVGTSRPGSQDGGPQPYEDMRPLKATMDPEVAKELRLKRQAAREREAKVSKVAGQVAARTNAMRGQLFDTDDWKRAHSSRQERMESTFSKLYQPKSKAYWVNAANAKVPKKPPPGSHMLPAYVNDLPHALSLAHPASREEDDDEETDVVEEAEPESKPREEVFDPMAGPIEFYRNFKSRVRALRDDVAAPPPVRVSSEARIAEKGIAAAVKEEEPPAEEEAEPTVETLDYDPSLVYTDTMQYLADAGVNLPTWDDAIDEQLRALDQAHLDALAADDEAISRLAVDRLRLETLEAEAAEGLNKSQPPRS